MNKFITIISSLIIYLFSSWIPRAHAQSTTLKISPPVVEILIAPNKKATQTFHLKYLGDNILIIPELHLVSPDGTSGHSLVDPSPVNPSSIPLIVRMIGREFGEPISTTGDTLPLTLTFEAASTDIAKDVYLALVIRAISADSPLSASPTTPAISALILTTINPTGVMPINLEIKDFTPPFFHDSWGTFTINPIAKNNVPIMIRPEGKYEIISPSGKTVLSIPLYPNLILGNSSRLLQGSELCKENDIQSSEPCKITNLSWSPSWRDVGPHRIHLTLTTQGGTKLTDVEKVIWIIPIKIIIFVSLFIILFIVYFATRQRSQTFNTALLK